MELTTAGQALIHNKFRWAETGSNLSVNAGYTSIAPAATQKITALEGDTGRFDTTWGAGLTGVTPGAHATVASTTNGNGTGATFNLTINGAGNAIVATTSAAAGGSGYKVGDTVTVSAATIGSGSGSSTLTLAANQIASGSVEFTWGQGPTNVAALSRQYLAVDNASSTFGSTETHVFSWVDAPAGTIAAGSATQVLVYTGPTTAGGFQQLPPDYWRLNFNSKCGKHADSTINWH